MLSPNCFKNKCRARIFGEGFNRKTMRKEGGIEEGERVFFFCKYVVEEKRREKERERERERE